MVVATQNPIEQLGTYKLPEAQMDRFLIKTSVGYPGHQVSVDLLRQVNIRDRAQTVSPVLAGDDILALRGIGERIHIDDNILEYIVRIVEATRHDENIAIGSSMRGALALTRCARIWAASDGRGYVVPDDVKDLAVAVLSHRIKLTAEATFAGNTPEQMIGQILEDVPARPWAPTPETQSAPGIRTTQSERSRNAAFAHSAAQTDHPTIPTPPQTSHQATGHLIRVAARMGRDRTRHRLTHSVHNPQLA